MNRHAAALRRQGVEAIVVLAHSGARHAQRTSGAAAGEIVDEARDMTGAVDVVIAGHTHSYLNTRVPNRSGGGDKLVIEAEVARHGVRPGAHDDRPRDRRGDRQERRHAGDRDTTR